MLNIGTAKVENISEKATRQLKIAMFSIHSCPMGELGTEDTGGMNVYIKELADELNKQGHCVDVFTRFHGAGHGRLENISDALRYIHLPAGENKHINKLAIYRHLTGFFDEVEAFREQEKRRYDIIHSHYWLSGKIGLMAQGKWQIPHIVMFHTLGKVKNTTGVGEKEPDLRIHSEDMLIKSSHRIIATTNRGKRELVENHNARPESISVVPCGVNLDLFQPMNKTHARSRLKLRPDDKIMLYVGRFAALKGLDRLLLAMTHLGDQFKPQLIIIGGDGPDSLETQKLYRLSNELGIQDRVSFVGRVDHENLPPYYNAADLLVIPSHHESFGMVALESMACGTPVIATNVGAMEMLIQEGKTGSILQVGSPEKLAAAAAAHLRKPAPRLDTKEDIRASVTGFAWSNIGDAMLSEYSGVLDSWEPSKQRNEAPNTHQTHIPSRI